MSRRVVEAPVLYAPGVWPVFSHCKSFSFSRVHDGILLTRPSWWKQLSFHIEGVNYY